MQLTNIQNLSKHYLKWKNLSANKRALICEVLGYSLLSKLQIQAFSFKQFSKSFGQLNESNGTVQFETSKSGEIRTIFNLIDKISNHLPWETKCLLKVHTASHSLRKRKQSFTTIFGIQANSSSHFPMDAHVWIEISEELALEKPLDNSLQQIAKYTCEYRCT